MVPVRQIPRSVNLGSDLWCTMKTSRRTSPDAPRSAAGVPATPAREIEPPTPNSGGPVKIPPQWAWHFRTLLHLRERLERAHHEHASEVNLPPDTDSNDLADSAQERAERDVLWAELGAESDKLFEIDCALQRIRDGVYGFCESSGRAIPPERLRAVPWTRYSREVAAAQESRASRRI